MTTAHQALYKAYRSKAPLAKGSLDLPTPELAYAVQDAVLNLKEADGEQLAGYKISLTSAQTQALFHTNAPLFGQMTDTTIRQRLSLADYNQPLLEMELVFLVQEDIQPTDSDDTVMAKCLVAPGLEIPDSRYADWFPKTTFHEVIADGAVGGAVSYGNAQQLSYSDIDDIEGQLFFNGNAIKSGRSTEVLGHPVNAVKWLSSALAQRGEVLKAGRFVSSGTFILPVPLEVGVYEARYETVGNVSVTVTD